MKSNVYIAILVATSLAGCVLSVTEENAASLSTQQLCYAAAVSAVGNSAPINKVNALAELERRGELTRNDVLLMLPNTLVQPGMSERAAICMWGGTYDAVNVTQTTRGVRKQYVDRSDYRSTYYFYTENGVVTAVQY